ncbi:hypothetical protein MLD38_012371 [Melastoma candidum]|uniref:Uncharacterized protein n=1 Tax=Melastoma candidum TaxID=119954 RepID=A0ACB9R5Q0_9MYRT|nr:hypothetical protein MLD38_012371 [Melastoma candidum]
MKEDYSPLSFKRSEWNLLLRILKALADEWIAISSYLREYASPRPSPVDPSSSSSAVPAKVTDHPIHLQRQQRRWPDGDMSVMLVTSLGDIVVDLYTEKCPLTCKNFLKLCKYIKYYNGCLFHTIQKDFTAQTGDPTGTREGGDSIYKFLYGDQARFFTDEIHHDLKHSKIGTLAMASAGENLNASQVFGEVAEGLETLSRINEAFVDEKGRPYKNIRVRHTYVLDDPFDDPAQLAEFIPDASPDGKPRDEVVDEVRLEDDWVPLDEQLGPAELDEVIRAKEAHSSAVVLESIGDIPDADIKPPENVLFVCKLNPVTEDEDLHIIFSRFGTVVSADIIRDFKTGDSLCYAFIEFETKESCEMAYFKMDNALIDDRRIHVDFSQSVAKLWSQYRLRDNQKNRGKGCFKCGSADHVARDCSRISREKQASSKYILRDENPQHGGDNSRYDMVFEDVVRDGSKYEDNYPKKQKREDQRDMSRESFKDKKSGEEDTRGPSDKHRQLERSRHRYEERGRHGEFGRRWTGHEDKEEKRNRERHEEHHVNGGSRETRRSVENRDQRDGHRDKSYRMSSSRDIDTTSESDGNKQKVKGDDSTERGSSGDKQRSADRAYASRDRDTSHRGMVDDLSHRKPSERDFKYTDREEDRSHRSRDTERDRDYTKRHRGDRRDEDDYICDKVNQTDRRRR